MLVNLMETLVKNNDVFIGLNEIQKQLNCIYNQNNYSENNIKEINNEKKEKEKKKEIICPENEEEENKQIQLALKQSEEESKIILEKEEEEEEKQIQLALKQSEKESKIILEKEEEEEEKQIQLALKLSEEEAKLLLEKEEEENKQIQIALNESQRLNNINDIINDTNEFSLFNSNEEEKEEEEEEFDEEYGICPITQEYMNEPVLSPSGNYYEKSAIIKWIEKNHTDPLTRENLTVDQLIEDEEYKKEIIKYRKKFNK